MVLDDEPERAVFIARASDDDVQTILSLIAGGLADYDDPDYYGPAARRDHIMAPGVEAACRNCHIIARGYRLAAEKPGFKVKLERNRVTFILRDDIEVWFKKLGEDGRPRHRKSKQSDEYLTPILQETISSQPRLLDLPPAMVRVVAGYRSANVAATDYDILVTGRRKAGGWWQAPLFRDEIEQLASAPAPKVAEVVASRLTLKDRKKTRGTGKTPE